MARNATSWPNYNFIILSIVKIKTLCADFYENVTIIKKKTL